MRRNRLALRLLLAGDFSKLMQYMHGIKKLPEGHGVALLTSQNPRETNPSVAEGEQKAVDVNPTQNDQLYRQLLQDLKNREHVFWKAQGDYGKQEKSVAILNITPEEALGLGRKYNQESVIWSGLLDGKLVHRMLYSQSGQDAADPVVNKQLWVKKMKDAESYFTKIDNRKFTIPFFPSGEKVEPLPGKVTRTFPKQEKVSV